MAFGIEYADSTRVWIVSHSYTIMDDNDYNATERVRLIVPLVETQLALRSVCYSG